MYKKNYYWSKKIENKTKIAVNDDELAKKRISANIPVSEMGYFNKISNNNYYSKFTILISLFSYLLKKYFADFNGTIRSYDDEFPILLDINVSNLSNITLKEFIIQNKTEVDNSFSNTPYQRELALHDYSDIDFVVNETSEKKSKRSSLYFQCTIKEEIIVEIEFDEKIFDSRVMKSFLYNFKHAVVDIEKYLNEFLSEIILISEEDLLRLEKCCETEKLFPDNKSMVDLFEAQVEINPGNIALSYESNDYTYEKLNSRANQLGYFIRENYNIKKGEVIVVLMPKSIESIISFISISTGYKLI